jgi:hypothetical protein
MNCRKCNARRSHRRLTAAGLALCRDCYQEARAAALRGDHRAISAALGKVATDARKLEWNRGRWSADVELEEGYWSVDLHGLNARLAEDAMEHLLRVTPKLGIERLRVIVGKGGGGVLDDIAWRALRSQPRFAVSRGDGWIDAVWGPRTEYSVVAREEPQWALDLPGAGRRPVPLLGHAVRLVRWLLRLLLRSTR